jgi:nitroreductase
VEPEKIRSIFEAARWAPSSNNEQPWRFLVATRDQASDHGRLFACLSEGNRKWAHRAPVLILSVAELNFEADDKPNRHAFHDVGLALENLLLQATALGLAAHPMAGFDQDKARESCSIPSGFDPVAMIAVGYPGDESLLPDYLREREFKPRERNRASEFVFSPQWGQVSPLIR